MEIYDETTSLKNLQEECKKLGLASNGKKSVLLVSLLFRWREYALEWQRSRKQKRQNKQ